MIVRLRCDLLQPGLHQPLITPVGLEGHVEYIACHGHQTHQEIDPYIGSHTQPQAARRAQAQRFADYQAGQPNADKIADERNQADDAIHADSFAYQRNLECVVEPPGEFVDPGEARGTLGVQFIGSLIGHLLCRQCMIFEYTRSWPIIETRHRNRSMKSFGTLIVVIALLLAGYAAYALLVPSPFAPQAWQPEPIAAARSALPPAQPITQLQRLGVDVASGPETVAIDDQDRLYVGYADGTIRRFSADGSHKEVFATTNGRPLGLAFGPTPQPSRPAGAADSAQQSATGTDNDKPATKTADDTPTPAQTLYVADAEKGLLAINPKGQISMLASGADGTPFGFTDDVDVAPDGKVYFSDASSKYGNGHYLADILEHGGHGRLLEFNPANGQTQVLLSGLQFANGVAVGPQGRFVAVTETGAYRVTRYWLSGPKAGTHDSLVDNLPGFPDGISFNGSDRFWVALFAPRNALLDGTANHPWLRKLIFHLPAWAQPAPKHVTQILGLSSDGRIVDNLVDRDASAYAPVTSVTQDGDTLYLGSLTQSAFARMPAPSDTP